MFQVGLVSDQYDLHLLYAVISDLFDPILNVLKRRVIINRVGEDDTLSILVERLSDIAESLLTSCVPNVQTDIPTVNLRSLDFKVHTDGA
jgi:hypothetical protein